MALNFTELAAEVKAELGKTDDTTLITTARAGRWINDAIRYIIYQNPGLRDVDILDKITLTLQTDVYEYDLKAFTDKPVAHILVVKYIDTTNQRYWRIKPFNGGLEAWDDRYPYIPDISAAEPHQYARRGNMLEIVPKPSSDENGAALWLHYSYLPRELSGTETPVLTFFDEAIIQRSKVYAYKAMSKTDAKFAQKAALQAAEADRLIAERVAGEKDFDEIDQLPDYYGP